MRRRPIAVSAVLLLILGSHYGLGAQRGLTLVPGFRTNVPAAPAAVIPQRADIAGLTAARADALVAARQRGLDYMPGEVLVKFRSGVSAAGQQRVLGAIHSRATLDQLRWSGDVARISDDTLEYPIVTASILSAQPEVEFAQPNYIRRVPASLSVASRGIAVTATSSRVPNDPDFGELQWNFPLINVPGAWDISPGGDDAVIVAVIDTGLTTAATTLTRPLWTGQKIETVNLPFQVSPDLRASRLVLPHDYAFEPGSQVLDFDGHGTHVASTIAEEANNTVALAGMAYRVKIMPLKVCVGFWELMLDRAARNIPGYISSDAGGCADDAIVAAIRFAADNGAKVINLSLGGPDPSQAERDAIAYAIGKGAFVAAAMGNQGAGSNEKEYPAGYAAMDGLMSVGAVGQSKARAYYSTTGAHVEIAAPGGSDRDGANEDTQFVWQVTLHPTDQNALFSPKPRFDRYAEVGYIGTSMATPHVSALAALLVSRGITDPKAIELIIKGSALDLGPSGRDDQFGYGLIQARSALFGFGVTR